MMIEISSHTDVGDVKQTNQDCIFAKTDVINKHTAGLFIVADGCGGLAYGEEISNLIVTHFSRVWNYELKELLQNQVVKSDAVNSLLENAIKNINSSALAFSSQVDSKVGSTLSLLLTIDNIYYIKNVGDSRVYLVRGKRVIQLTEDQSLVADMIRNGEITKEEAKNFKKKNVLTMCIGFFNDIKTYSKSGKIKNKDIFLICCDGLHNHVSSDKMFEILSDKTVDFNDKAEAMRRTINQGEANDNVSSVIAKYSFSQRKKYLIIVAVALVLITLIMVFGKHALLHWTLSRLGEITNDIVFTCSCGKQFGGSLIFPLSR